MTISATIPTRHDYQGNGVATSFSYSLKTNNKTHLKLIHTDTAGLENALGDLVVDTDYTVNGVGDAGGGTVDFPKAGSVYSILATNEKLAIIYNLPIEQTTDIPNTGRIFNVSIEDQLDYMTILINQLKELLDRSIKLPEGSTLTDITFAEGTSASNRASKVNVWNALGTALELLSVTSGLNVDPIAVKGDIVQGDVNGDAAKLAIGGTGSILNVVSGLLQYLSIGSSGDILSVVSGLLAYDKPWGVCWKKGADIASTAALTTGDDGNYFDVTGIDAITSIVTRGAGSIIRLHFDGALVLTHHATDLILPNGANITTIAGDEATFVEYATGDWRMVAWSGHVLEHTHASVAQGGTLPALPGSVAQVVNYQTGALVTGATIMPGLNDDTIPQITEGAEFMTLAITPKSASNKLKIDVVFNCCEDTNVAAVYTVALFNTDYHATNAMAAAQNEAGNNLDLSNNIMFSHFMTAPSGSATTFRVRAGMDAAGTLNMNGGVGGRQLGGVLVSSINITEIWV